MEMGEIKIGDGGKGNRKARETRGNEQGDKGGIYGREERDLENNKE